MKSERKSRVSFQVGLDGLSRARQRAIESLTRYKLEPREQQQPQQLYLLIPRKDRNNLEQLLSTSSRNPFNSLLKKKERAAPDDGALQAAQIRPITNRC